MTLRDGFRAGLAALALALPLATATPAAADRWHDEDRYWYRGGWNHDPFHRHRHHHHGRRVTGVIVVAPPAPPPVIVQPPPAAVQAPAPAYCREYTSTATVGGRPVETYGTACRQPDGSWRIISSNPVP